MSLIQDFVSESEAMLPSQFNAWTMPYTINLIYTSLETLSDCVSRYFYKPP